MFFLTCLIIVSLTWGWDEILDTRRSASLFYITQTNNELDNQIRQIDEQLCKWLLSTSQKLVPGIMEQYWGTYAVTVEFLDNLGLLVLSKLVSFHFIHFA